LVNTAPNFGPLAIRPRFVLAKKVSKPIDPNAIFKVQEEEEC